ncbi:hypothetical protein EZV62_018787 [Acer yangbiense]|uniref:Ferric oxidoreductase domain-containing protein n=1 Tax=Acer yangbiense TaxID=1000413 RepID=A0A5C7H9B4_9ROSI|nr:hypothetical protein EZV62_018787 [Acer yangbiense]
MEENPGQEPLLATYHHQYEYYTRKISDLLLSSVKWVLIILMWVVFVAWVVLIFLYPLNSVNYWVKDLCNHTLETFLGIEGAVFLIFSGPILVIAFLSIPYLIISRKQQLHHHAKKNSGKYGWSHRLSTFPVLVDGPFGVVSAAEVIGILSVIVFVIWAVFVYALRDLTIFDEAELTKETIM